MVEEFHSHLLRQPFAPVFNNLRSNEDKSDVIALELMCILDYHLQSMNLYNRIAETQRPKLLMDLMRFRSYKSFFYYEYQGHGQLEGKYLKCRFCELFGPYVLILTHMTINHDEHIGLVKCAYCNQTDLKTHFQHGTMQTCYERYLEKPDVADVIDDTLTPTIITDFYGFLKNLSINLGVHTRRILHSFTGTFYGATDRISGRNARIASYEVGYRQRKTRKNISIEKLNAIASHVWMDFYGRILPIQSSEPDENDGGTNERSTRSNRTTHVQNENLRQSNEELNQNVSEPSTPGIRISRAYSLGGHANTSSPTFSTTSAHTSDTHKTAEAKFGDYVTHRLELQTGPSNRRRLEAVIQQAISNFEISQLENQ